MSNDKRELAKFLKEVAGWDWITFLKAEKDEKFTTRQSIVFALIRAAAMEDLKAITVALNRLDGKMELPVQVLMPKVYYLFPNATEVVLTTVIEDTSPPENGMVVFDENQELEEMPSQSFRETMEKMATKERTLPGRIIKCQEQWEAFFRNEGQAPVDEHGQTLTVKVSSVVAAKLLKMAQHRDMRALDEVFNQLDGKLVETIRVVGEDMYIMQFGSIAPAGAIKNEQGIYQIEVPKMSKMWGERLDPLNKTVQATVIEEGQ